KSRRPQHRLRRLFRKDRPYGSPRSYLFIRAFFRVFPGEVCTSRPSLSSTAATISGKPTVASTKTSPKRPPSAGGTNFPQEIASLYGLPDSPPQYTGSGQIRTPK